MCWQPPLFVAHSSLSKRFELYSNSAFDIFCMTCLLFGNSCIHFILPVKNIAANPLFCTELSDRNSMRNEFPSDVITGGSLDPQKTPCLRISPDPIFEDKAKLSYSQSC